jgi:hypothetical protein
MQAHDGSFYSTAIVDGSDLIQLAAEWANPGPLDRNGIHAATVEGSQLPHVRVFG